jgi:hypothetical protein
LIFHNVRGFHLPSEQISLNFLIDRVTKIINCETTPKVIISIVLFFLYRLDLVLHAIKDCPLLLDHISLDILIEHIIKTIKMWDIRLWSQLLYFFTRVWFNFLHRKKILFYVIFGFTFYTSLKLLSLNMCLNILRK